VARRAAEPRPGRKRSRCRRDAGAAPVEFVLVGTLLLFLMLGVLQVGLFLHVRNTLAADAAEGARHAANLGVSDSDGAPYAQRLISATVPGRADASCTSEGVEDPSGIALVEVRCSVNVPLSLVPLGASRTIVVVGHAIKEQA
jgi:Flp pilus assembly protein TadG